MATFPRIRWATEADLPNIAEVSSLAFDPRHDAVAACIFPARLQTDGKLSPLVQVPWRTSRKVAALGNPNGRMIVLEDVPAAVDGAHVSGEQSPVIVGFANWYTTETPYKEPHVPAPANGDEEAWVRLKKHVGETSKATFGEEALENLWYLSHLAVHPEHQRKGHGRRLIDKVVMETQEAEREMYLLGTPAAVPLYKAVGFREVGKVDLNGLIHAQMILNNPREGGD